ncbi:hypothetical protein L195_g047335, partial [Trifolium pratense]
MISEPPPQSVGLSAA